jgi:crossover junction endodeoxyribonuclease RuvC
MIIIGIDPGTAITGWGVVQKKKNAIQYIAHGTIETLKTKEAPQRLHDLERELVSLFAKYKPSVVGVERLYFAKNLTTAMPVAQARGIVLLCIAKTKASIKEFTPLQVKAIVTGYGKAEKQQVQRMVQHTLQLSFIPKPDDAADALGVAIATALAVRG